MKLSDVDLGKAMFCLFKGEPGTRKSTAAASFPKPYFLDIDRKISSLITPWKGKTDIEYDEYSRWYKIERKLEELANSSYKTIVVDSLTSAGDVINANSIMAKGGGKGKKIGGIAVNTVEDYNAETAALLRIVSLGKELQETGKHFILIAHVIDSSYRELSGGTVVCRTLVTGGKKIAAKLPAYFPEIYHFQRVPSMDVSLPSSYEILTQNMGDEFARTTLDLPSKILFEKDLWGVIQESLPKKEVTGQQTVGLPPKKNDAFQVG